MWGCRRGLLCVCVCVSCSVLSDSLQPCGLHPSILFCPWNFPGENTGVGCHFVLQGIFPTQGSNPGLRCCSQILFYFGTVYCAQRGRAQSFLAAAFLMAAGTLLSPSLHCSTGACPHPFLDQLEGPLVLGDREQLPGPPLIRGEAACLPGRVLRELGVFVGVRAAAAACLGSLTSLAALWPLLRPTATG